VIQYIRDTIHTRRRDMPTTRPYKTGKVPKPDHQPPHAHAMRFSQKVGNCKYFRCTVCGLVRWIQTQ